jgi:hypothetical protein
MSDMLEKLLGVEKAAAALVAEAESEAGHRATQARGDIQKKIASLVKDKSVAADAALTAERERVAAERTRKNAEHRESLARATPNAAAFNRAALAFLEKGSR